MIFLSVTCDDSVFSHFRLTMVDENGFPEDDDAVSRYSGNDQADVEDHVDLLAHDLDMSGTNTSHSSDDDGDGDGLDDTNCGDGDGVLNPPT